MDGVREGGRERGPPNRARNSVHQATCRAKQAIAEQYWGMNIYLVVKY